MKRLLSVFLLFGIALASDVLDLSEVDFEEVAKPHDVLLVEFFAPWCGHCKRLAPKYEEAATILKKLDPPLTIAKVDCTTDGGKDTCSKFGVSGYPTLKVFRNGEFSSEYNSGRETDAIVKYMKSQAGPSSRVLKSVADCDKLSKSEEVTIVGYFSESASALEVEFLKLADKLRETHNFAHTNEKEVLEKYGYTDAVVLYRPKHLSNKFEDDKVQFDGEADKAALDKFVKSNYHGLVGVRTHENYQEFETPILVAYYDVDYVKNAKGTNYYRNRIMKVAQDYKDKLSFAVSDKTKFAAEMDEFGVDSKSNKPQITIKDSKQQKYRMIDEFSMDSLRKFIEDYEAGNLDAHLKSEDVPESNDGPVKVAVAKNFQELVTDSEKDVLIEFYAPWCGHCKKLAPTFEELGTALAEENVEIVKMDATANDVPSPFEVNGFPTLYFLPKDQKSSPRKYEGGREVEDFVKYLAKHATDEMKGYDRKGNKKKAEL